MVFIYKQQAMAGPSPTSGWHTANMLTLAQQRNLRDRQQNYRIPLRWTDCVLQATRTHRQFGAHFTFTTVTEEAMRRDRRSLRHVFRETVWLCPKQQQRWSSVRPLQREALWHQHSEVRVILQSRFTRGVRLNERLHRQRQWNVLCTSLRLCFISVM